MKKYRYSKVVVHEEIPILKKLQRTHTVFNAAVDPGNPEWHEMSFRARKHIENLKSEPCIMSNQSTVNGDAEKASLVGSENSQASTVVITDMDLTSSWLYKNRKGMYKNTAGVINEAFDSSPISMDSPPSSIAPPPPPPPPPPSSPMPSPQINHSLLPPTFTFPQIEAEDFNDFPQLHLKPVPIAKKKTSKCAKFCYVAATIMFMVCLLGLVSSIGGIVYLELFVPERLPSLDTKDFQRTTVKPVQSMDSSDSVNNESVPEVLETSGSNIGQRRNENVKKIASEKEMVSEASKSNLINPKILGDTQVNGEYDRRAGKFTAPSGSENNQKKVLVNSESDERFGEKSSEEINKSRIDNEDFTNVSSNNSEVSDTSGSAIPLKNNLDGNSPNPDEQLSGKYDTVLCNQGSNDERSSLICVEVVDRNKGPSKGTGTDELKSPDDGKLNRYVELEDHKKTNTRYDEQRIHPSPTGSLNMRQKPRDFIEVDSARSHNNEPNTDLAETVVESSKNNFGRFGLGQEDSIQNTKTKTKSTSILPTKPLTESSGSTYNLPSNRIRTNSHKTSQSSPMTIGIHRSLKSTPNQEVKGSDVPSTFSDSKLPGRISTKDGKQATPLEGSFVDPAIRSTYLKNPTPGLKRIPTFKSNAAQNSPIPVTVPKNLRNRLAGYSEIISSQNKFDKRFGSFMHSPDEFHAVHKPVADSTILKDRMNQMEGDSDRISSLSAFEKRLGNLKHSSQRKSTTIDTSVMSNSERKDLKDPQELPIESESEIDPSFVMFEEKPKRKTLQESIANALRKFQSLDTPTFPETTTRNPFHVTSIPKFPVDDSIERKVYLDKLRVLLYDASEKH